MRTHGLHGPYGPGTARVCHGTTAAGTHRARCRTGRRGRGRTLLLASPSAGPASAGPQQSVARAMTARGMRETAWVGHVSRPTVMQERKKRRLPSHRGSRRCCRSGPQCPWRARAGAPRSWRGTAGCRQHALRGGALWASKRRRAGGGRRSSPPGEPWAPLAVGDARLREFATGKRGERPVASRALTPRAGGLRAA